MYMEGRRAEHFENWPEVSPEYEKEPGETSRIVIKIMRHSEKEKDPSKDDKDIELTPNGRQMAKAKAEPGDLEQSVAFGSPRARAQETAALVMAGAEDEITGEENLEELRAKLNAERKYGTKIGSDTRLDFGFQEGSPYWDQLSKAYEEGRFLDFLVNESDELAKKAGDKVTETYSRSAMQVAQILKKYKSIASRFDELVKDDSKNYGEAMYRFLGTHQGIGEGFLAKVIDKLHGRAERNRFVQSLKGKGFDFVEGFEADIITKNGEPELQVKYAHSEPGMDDYYKLNEVVSSELLDEIEQEGTNA
jgi:hypothetical protein